MALLAQITGIYFFSTIVALLHLMKMAGLWKGCPASLQQSVKCPEWEHFRKMCHRKNPQLTGDQPEGNTGCSQVSQVLPKAFCSGSSPVGAEMKNVLLCFQLCPPQREAYGEAPGAEVSLQVIVMGSAPWLGFLVGLGWMEAIPFICVITQIIHFPQRRY